VQDPLAVQAILAHLARSGAPEPPGLPHPPVTPELMNAVATVRINPTGELAEPIPIAAALSELDKLQGYTPTDTDRQDSERQFPQLKGQSLIDRDGIVRWANVEGASEGVAGVGKFPTDEQLIAAARALAR
jgi:hypothetical protein